MIRGHNSKTITNGPWLNLDLPQTTFLCSSFYEKNERRSTNERRSREETTCTMCTACMESNLICIFLAGNYCYDVMDASSLITTLEQVFCKFWKPLEITALLAKGRISTSSLSLLLHFNPYMYIGVNYQRESRGRQQKRT